MLLSGQIDSIMRQVKFCDNSTITEAWALITGLPAPVDETDSALLTRSAKHVIADLEPRSAVVAVQVQDDLAGPF